MEKHLFHWVLGLLITVVFSIVAGCGTSGGESTGTFNTAPVANAGVYKNVVTDTVVTLDGRTSSDINGDKLGYRWEFTSKPSGSNATLLSSATAKPSFIPDVAGMYTFSLVVSDGKTNSGVANGVIEAVKVVSMVTSMGTIKIELNGQKAPISTQNFLDYATSGFYDNTIFHRIIPSFMIQGGGFTSALVQKTTNPPIKNEAANGLKNLRGTVSMARTQVVDSATSQFFINVVDNATLDYTASTSEGYGYAVFGKVIEGMEIVDMISAVTTGAVSGTSLTDVPITPIIISSVSALK
jgi:cyclophilin family peptidyl-prolyl cis-trans isomerase